MNTRLLSKYLGILAILIGVGMLFSLIWAWPQLGWHTHSVVTIEHWEIDGILGLIASAAISWAMGGLLLLYGRSSQGKLFRKEAMAVVGLSWILATVLGALPYVLSGTSRGPSIRIFDQHQAVMVNQSPYLIWQSWRKVEIEPREYQVLKAVAQANARGLERRTLVQRSGVANAVEIFRFLQTKPDFEHRILGPGDLSDAPADRASHFRQAWVKMTLVDSMFEAQSGFSTTGATVLCDLEDPYMVPHCILFWRASTHFLGGLGIIALFVVLLGQGSAGKSLMRNETPGPSQESSGVRMQHTAWLFAATYAGLNLVLAIILYFFGMNVFDSICHAFATMATGGFSTYNASLGHFVKEGANGIAIEYTVIVFMLLAGANFTLLFLCFTGNPLALIKDLEFRTYIGIIAFVTLFVCVLGYLHGDSDFDTFEHGFRNGLFQVISIITTTGYGTADFDAWNDFGRGALLALMFVGGCAGSTGGGLKVIRYVLLVKILGLEIEHAYQPRVVRPLKIGGKPLDDQNLRHSIVVYFTLIATLFVFGFLFVILFEPDTTWGINSGNKLIDSASAVASTLNNIGPGLGTVGATRNYADFSPLTKSLFIWLMMLGRLEVFPILILLAPGFWRDQ
jgi:trk system potassium uptake protein TrkH